MGEIKCRAWHKERKMMVEVVGIVDVCVYETWISNGRRYNIRVEAGKDYFEWVQPGEIEVMQYTGEFDRNGHEICQGDDDEGASISEVQFEAGAFVVDHDFGDFERTAVGWVRGEECTMEILGNIYENSDLLK